MTIPYFAAQSLKFQFDKLQNCLNDKKVSCLSLWETKWRAPTVTSLAHKAEKLSRINKSLRKINVNAKVFFQGLNNNNTKK